MIVPYQPDPKQFRLALNPREAADALGISERTLMDLVARNEIPCTRIGRRNLRFSVQALQVWLNHHTIMPAAIGVPRRLQDANAVAIN